jgi:hypothetical protein
LVSKCRRKANQSKHQALHQRINFDIIPPLSRAGLIKPLGRPQRYCVKHYSRDVLAQQPADVNWLDKVMAAIHRHWRIENASKRAKQAGNSPANGTLTRESVTR